MAIPFGGTYTTGTVSVAANGTTVTGVGTLWTQTAVQGDWFFANGNVGIINAVTDDTHLQLMTPWTGGLLTAASYVLIQMSWLRYDPAITQAQVRQLVTFLDNAGLGFGSADYEYLNAVFGGI